MAQSKTKIPCSKDIFINKLMEMTPSEINEFIKKNGKPPKPIPIFVKVRQTKEEHING